MSEEKKTAVTEEVKEEVRKLTEEELAQVSGGVVSDICKEQPVLEFSTNKESQQSNDLIIEDLSGWDKFDLSHR